jgi:hypothetical protein
MERAMPKLAKVVFVNVMVLSCLAATADAQNHRMRPVYGAVDLVAGFQPDPYTRILRAGGDNLYWSDSCRAYFADAPDYRLNYRARGAALSIYVRANGDTALLIRNPTGAWNCNDDQLDLDPGIHFRDPPSGQYDIWVGTSASGETHGGDELGYLPPDRVNNSRLFISERGLFMR